MEGYDVGYDKAKQLTKEYEGELRQRAARDAAPQYQGEHAKLASMNPIMGAATGGTIGPLRSIRGRIDRALAEADGIYRRAVAAQRAKQIIDQHPEFAELLDALNEF